MFIGVPGSYPCQVGKQIRFGSLSSHHTTLQQQIIKWYSWRNSVKCHQRFNSYLCSYHLTHLTVAVLLYPLQVSASFMMFSVNKTLKVGWLSPESYPCSIITQHLTIVLSINVIGYPCTWLVTTLLDQNVIAETCCSSILLPSLLI